MKEVYGIAEELVVMDVNDGDGLENGNELVVCIPLGVFTSFEKAEKRCNRLNKGQNDDSRFQPVRLQVRS